MPNEGLHNYLEVKGVVSSSVESSNSSVPVSAFWKLSAFMSLVILLLVAVPPTEPKTCCSMAMVSSFLPSLMNNLALLLLESALPAEEEAMPELPSPKAEDSQPR